ncbi:Zinc finger, RING-type [Corchorus olitorius]|uniref:Zinc finger, RING-type n=1 Tax=Corchorus olitorius TaxID=93759 RepID=A0A1R3KQX9_9ROSI|nr:Zinc finger, RING-type [Corchorus olitorius]
MSLPHPQPDGDGQFLFLIKSGTNLPSPVPAASNIPKSFYVPFDLESLSSKKDVEELVYGALWGLEQFEEEGNVTALGKSISEFLFNNYSLGLGLGFSNPNSPKPVIVVEVNQTRVYNLAGDCGGDMGMDEVAMIDQCNYDEEFIDLSLRNLFFVSDLSVIDPIDDSEPLGLTQVPRLDSFQQFEYSVAAADPDEPTSCAICLEAFPGNSGFKLPCSHVFHGDCVAQWLWRKRSCPLCRFQLS